MLKKKLINIFDFITIFGRLNLAITKYCYWTNNSI